MDEFERFDTDELKSSRTRDKHESKHERSRVRKTKTDKDRSPVHCHRYVVFTLDYF